MMSFAEFVALQRRLVSQRENPEWAMLARHDLLRKKPGMPWRDFLFRKWRTVLAIFGLAPPYVSGYAWLASLKHVPATPGSRVILLWAVAVADRETLRQACSELQQRLTAESGYLPVLITDVADFAFYSRLGWLVEYLPELSGEGDSYAERKCRYLAWRYRDAVVFELSAALLPVAEWNELLKGEQR